MMLDEYQAKISSINFNNDIQICLKGLMARVS